MKIKLRENNKAIIKFDSAIHSAQEKQWFINLMRSIRDSDPKTHPAISIRDINGEIPKLPPPKPPMSKEQLAKIKKKTEVKPPPDVKVI